MFKDLKGKKSYSKKDIINIIEKTGLQICGDVKTISDKILCITSEGYKVFAYPNGIIRRNDKPSVFSKYNPYTIENIRLYLKLKNITLKLISDTYENSTTKLEWMCECGEKFESSWDSIRSRKRYCNFCARSKRHDDRFDYFFKIEEKCKLKNYELITKSITRSNQIFKYRCNKHINEGIQCSTYDRFINRGSGCMFCGIESRGIKHRKINEDKFKSLIESKGFTYVGYDYDNKGKYKKVNILFICPNHIDKGIQKIKYANLLNSNGKCKYCIGRERTKDDLQAELYEMNSDISVLEYIDYSSDIKVVCNKCSHVWYTKGVSLTQGHGCPNCRSSNFERECSLILDKFNFNYIRQKWFDNCRDKNPLPFDFYLQDFNILIECDGEGHYKPIRYGSMSNNEALEQLDYVKIHDAIKTEYCNAKNIPLIRIPYWKRDDMEYFLWNELIKYNAIEIINKKMV